MMKRSIVPTNVDGLGEVLRHGEKALLVSPKNFKRLAIAIEDLLIDPNKAEQLAVQAQLDSKDFDIQKTVDKIQDIYEELIN